MGKATAARASTKSSRSASPAPSSEFDPAFPPNLERSLARNDVELAALGKLHTAIRALRTTIVGEYGEGRLVEAVVAEAIRITGVKNCGGNDEKMGADMKEEDEEATAASPASSVAAEVEGRSDVADDGCYDPDVAKSANEKRLKRLTTAFLLRMKLRRRLLNRLARRLRRVAHSIDGGSSASAPLPPLYGDVFRRYVTEEAEESGFAAKMMGGSFDNVEVIREKDMREFAKREEKAKELKEDLDKQRKRRLKENEKDQGRKKKVNFESIVEDGERKTVESEGKGDPMVGVDALEEVDFMDINNKASPVKGALNKIRNSSGGVSYDDDAVKDTESPNKTDLLLRGDEEDRPMLGQLVQYEPGYDKLYSIGAPPAPLLPSVSGMLLVTDSLKTSDDEKSSSGAGAAATEAEARRSLVTTAVFTESWGAATKQVIRKSAPIASSTDDHEVNDNGEFLNSKEEASSGQPSRLPFSLYSAPVRMLHPKERVTEWKRWTKEMCERIPRQVTFDELGIGGGGVVFESECGQKRRKDDGVPSAVAHRGKGKVLKQLNSVCDENGSDIIRKWVRPESEKSKLGDAKIGGSHAAEEKVENKKEDATAENPPKKSVHAFSLLSVPSFYYQDLKRVRLLQNELVNYRNVQRSRERVLRAQALYDRAYKISIHLQQAKATAIADYHKLIEYNKKEVTDVRNEGRRQLSVSKTHWEKRQFQIRDIRQQLGEECALVRTVVNELLQDMKDRVTIRMAEELDRSGLGTHIIKSVVEEARREGNERRAVSATVLGHIIDSVERRQYDNLANSLRFVPPRVACAEIVTANPKTGETMARVHMRRLTEMKRRIQMLDMSFKEAERKRGDAWGALSKAKGGGGTGPPPSGKTNSKSKPKSRKFMGSSIARVTPAATLVVGPADGAQPYTLQTQASKSNQPRGAPGTISSPNYQTHRPPAAVAPNALASASAHNMPTQATSRAIAAAARAAASTYVQVAPDGAQTALIAQMQNIVARNLAGVQGIPDGASATSQIRGGGVRFHPLLRPVASSSGQDVATVAVNVSGTTPGRSHPPPIVVVQPPTSCQALTAADAPLEKHPAQPMMAEAAPLPQKTSSLAKYGYGDKYSVTNVNARKNPDGTVVPASTPKLLPDGRFARPAGRQRKGMDWDADRGCWYPVPEGRPASSGDGQ